MKRKFVYSDILYNKRRKIMMYNEEYSNELSNEDFVSLVQNINNFIPSIDYNTNRYVCLDNLFKDSYNVKPFHVNGYITYKNFVNLLKSANSCQIELSGLYPVGSNPNGYVHYYVVIPTNYIHNKKDFINWFNSRGSMIGFSQDEVFIKNSLKNPFVILNGYIKGMSPLDTLYKKDVGHFSLGANMQPSQALCALNAVTLGLAFGLPAYTSFISSCALETCNNLIPAYFNRHIYTHNERTILMFILKMFYETTKGPFEPTTSFVYNLSTGASGENCTKQSLNKAKHVLRKLNKLYPSVITKYGINIHTILKIILDPKNTPQFLYWSQSD